MKKATRKGGRVEKLTMNLYKAVQAYVEHYGGTVVVAGGVSTIAFPGDPIYNWILGIKCTGRKPEFKEKNK